jgi:hypothetical protein
MKNNLLPYIKALVIVLTMVATTGCEVDSIEDPNNPGAGPISADATLSEIQNLVDGTESGMRDDINFYMDDVGVIGVLPVFYLRSPLYLGPAGKGECCPGQQHFLHHQSSWLAL